MAFAFWCVIDISTRAASVAHLTHRSCVVDGCRALRTSLSSSYLSPTRLHTLKNTVDTLVLILVVPVVLWNIVRIRSNIIYEMTFNVEPGCLRGS